MNIQFESRKLMLVYRNMGQDAIYENNRSFDVLKSTFKPCVF